MGLGSSNGKGAIFTGHGDAYSHSWNCVGAVQKFQDGIPAWNHQVCSTMELYVACSGACSPESVPISLDGQFLRVPSIFADHMVLQRDFEIPMSSIFHKGERGLDHDEIEEFGIPTLSKIRYSPEAVREMEDAERAFRGD